MKTNYVVFLLSLVAYCLLAYGVNRSDFLSFIALFSGTFACYFYWCLKAKTIFKKDLIKQFVLAAILFRFIFIFAYPELSDDFSRRKRKFCLKFNLRVAQIWSGKSIIINARKILVRKKYNNKRREKIRIPKILKGGVLIIITPVL